MNSKQLGYISEGMVGFRDGQQENHATNHIGGHCVRSSLLASLNLPRRNVLPYGHITHYYTPRTLIFNQNRYFGHSAALLELGRDDFPKLRRNHRSGQQNVKKQVLSTVKRIEELLPYLVSGHVTICAYWPPYKAVSKSDQK